MDKYEVTEALMAMAAFLARPLQLSRLSMEVEMRGFKLRGPTFFFLQILVLENVRFYKEETKNDSGFAQKVVLLRKGQVCSNGSIFESPASA